MSSICLKCQTTIVPSSVVCCGICMANYHCKCTLLKTSEIKLLKSHANLIWKCDNCKSFALVECIQKINKHFKLLQESLSELNYFKLNHQHNLNSQKTNTQDKALLDVSRDLRLNTKNQRIKKGIEPINHIKNNFLAQSSPALNRVSAGPSVLSPSPSPGPSNRLITGKRVKSTSQSNDSVLSLSNSPLAQSKENVIDQLVNTGNKADGAAEVASNCAVVGVKLLSRSDLNQSEVNAVGVNSSNDAVEPTVLSPSASKANVEKSLSHSHILPIIAPLAEKGVEDVDVNGDCNNAMDLNEEKNECNNSVHEEDANAIQDKDLQESIVYNTNSVSFVDKPRDNSNVDGDIGLQVFYKRKWLHVSSFKATTTPEHIVTYIAKKMNVCSTLFACFSLLTRQNRDGSVENKPSFVNFKVGCPLEYVNSICRDDFWPNGVKVRIFDYKPKNV